MSIEPGASAALIARFAPTVFGNSSGQLDVESNGGRASFLVFGSAAVEFSGTVSLGSSPVAGVRLALEGGATATTTTDVDGRYAFILPPGSGGRTVAPVAPGYDAAPASHNGTVATADLTGLDFTLALRDPVGAFVGSLYEWVLGRAPDQGLDGWVAFLRESCGAERLATTLGRFFDTDELRRRALTPTDLASTVYFAVLGRGADTAGLAALAEHFRAVREFVAVEGLTMVSPFTKAAAEARNTARVGDLLS